MILIESNRNFYILLVEAQFGTATLERILEISRYVVR